MTPVTVGRTTMDRTALAEALSEPIVQVTRSLDLLAIPWLMLVEINVTPAGRRFVTVMPEAASGPMFVTVTEKVILRATTAGEELAVIKTRSEEHTSELQSHSDLVCRP